MNPEIMYITLFLLFLLPGVLSAFMPYLTRKTDSFGVSITEEIYYSERMKNIRKKYTIKSLIVLGIFFALTFFYFFKYEEPTNTYIYSAGLLLMLTALFFVYLKFHLLIKRLKKDEGWILDKKQVSLTDLGFRQRKIKYSNLWFFIPIIISVVTIALTWLNYDLIPEQIALNYDFQGNPTNYKDKSLLTVFTPAFMQIMMVGLFIFINNVISNSRQQLDPSNPEKSALQNEIFRRKWSAFTIVSGILMTLIFSLMQLSFFLIIDPSVLFVVTMLISLGITVFAIYLAITLGQGGSRIKGQYDQNYTEIERDQDEYWKLGQFYFNSEDPALFIEKRFGIGWTVNVGNKKIWFVLLISLSLIVLSIVITLF